MNAVAYVGTWDTKNAGVNSWSIGKDKRDRGDKGERVRHERKGRQ